MSRMSLALALGLSLVGCAYDTHGAGSAGSGSEAVAGRWAAADGGVEDETGDEGSGGEPDAAPTNPDLAVTSAVHAWQWRHGVAGDVPSADTSRCAHRLENLEVVVPSHHEFRRLCQRCDLTDDSPHCDGLGRVNGCAPFGGLREDDDGPVGRRHALIVLDATRAADPVQRDRLVIHETIHHLGECTMVGPDSTHDNHDWWCVDDPRCINGRARRLLSR